jgi:amino acid transporter
MRFSLIRLLLGRPLANREYGGRKIGAFEGVPAMGLDGLGSSAYGPEAALTALIPLGAASLSLIGWVMAPILGLLGILFASYWQTIKAYPSNGGAYIVSKENLGTNPSLLAAAALMTDYVLNVAVGISAGVGALISALPILHPYTLSLCLIILLAITIANLRGTIDAGRMFAVPTYTFVASFAVILTIGVYQAISSGGHPQPVVAPPGLPETTAATVGLWLLLKAFANGCTAMTGVEAVSNSMSAFRDPQVVHGHRTLTAIVVILGTLLAGIAYLAGVYGIGAMDQTAEGYRSVLSQLAGAVVGNGIFYSVAMASLLCVLALSANTSFVDFPRLCRMVAEDRFLPKSFAIVGRRLVFTFGILYLTVTAGLLLIMFGGITEHLIPLFAIGAFLTFTMSQTGMVFHWRRLLKENKDPSRRRVHRMHRSINATGAAITAIALMIIVVTKFSEGAWIIIVIIPLAILLLKTIKRYYDELDSRLRQPGPIVLDRGGAPTVLVATENWNQLTDKALSLALRISPRVMAVHLTAVAGPDVEESEGALRRQWAKDVEEPVRAMGLKPPKLVLLGSPYRQIHVPLLKLIRSLKEQDPQRSIAVIIPELVKDRWWQYLLHTHRARRLRAALLHYGGAGLAVINIPWHLKQPEIEQGLEEDDEAPLPAELTRV